MTVEQTGAGPHRSPAPAPASVALDGPSVEAIREAVSHLADVAVGTYFQSKLIQPDWRQVTFTNATGYTVPLPWTGAWSPQSVQVVNPNGFPLYVAANGDPLQGLPFPPNSTLRLPIAGNRGSLVIGLNPSDVDLSDTSVLVHLFRYPTVD